MKNVSGRVSCCRKTIFPSAFCVFPHKLVLRVVILGGFITGIELTGGVVGSSDDRCCCIAERVREGRSGPAPPFAEKIRYETILDQKKRFCEKSMNLP